MWYPFWLFYLCLDSDCLHGRLWDVSPLQENIKTLYHYLHNNKSQFTQLVASNIFTSSGSPWILPSRTINEWQTTIALNAGPQGRLWSAGNL